MCGIIAVFDSETGKPSHSGDLSTQIQDSLGYIAHRGPDATAVWVNDDATCGRSSVVGIRRKFKLIIRTWPLPTSNQ